MRPTLKSIDRLHWTVRKRRALAAKVPERRDNNFTHLLTHLQVLSEARTPDRIRVPLATNLRSLVYRRYESMALEHASPKKVLAICRLYWTILAVERNAKIRRCLYELGTRMHLLPAFNYRYRMPGIVRKTMLGHLTKKRLPGANRVFGLRLLLRHLEDMGVYSKADTLRVARGCMWVVDRHCDTADAQMNDAMRALALSCIAVVFRGIADEDGPHEPVPERIADLIMNSDHAISSMFEYMKSGDTKPIGHMQTLLAQFLFSLRIRDRVTVAIRHYPQLLLAFENLPFEDLVEVLYPPFAAIFSTSNSLLLRLALYNAHERPLQSPYSADHCHYAYIAGYVLEAAVESPSVLQNVLGWGLLSVCRFSKHFWGDFDDSFEDTFRRILNLHPEWRRQFVEWTCEGPQNSAIAQFGRSILLRPKLPGTWYILEEDVDTI